MERELIDTSNIGAVVLDLDGTLYPGCATLKSYVSYVFDSVGDIPGGNEILVETRAILDGRHPEIGLGSFVRGIAGTPTFEIERKRSASPESFGDGWMYLGDAWSVVYFLARQRDIPRQVFIDGFHASRYALAEGKLSYLPTARLRDALEYLRSNDIYTVMQTNSSEDSGWPTLEFLGIDTIFDEYIFNAQKPVGMSELFDRLEGEQGIPVESIVSVGDHPWNDVVSSQRRGGRSLFISPFTGFPRGWFSPRIDTINEMIEVMYSMTPVERPKAVGG